MGLTNSRSLVLCQACGAAILWLALGAAITATEPPTHGRLIGRVTDSDGAPVSTAVVRVMIEKQVTPNLARIPHAVSDADGRYAIDLPWGHAFCLGIQPPAGYYSDTTGGGALATSVERPTHEKNFILQRGARVRLALDEVPSGARYLLVNGAGTPAFNFFTVIETDTETDPAVTLPFSGGALTIHVLDQRHHPLGKCELSAPAKFDFEHLVNVAISSDGKNLAAHDAEHRQLIVTQGRPTLIDKTLALHPAPVDDQRKSLQVVGRVVDEQGRPLRGAEVQLGYRFGGPHGGSNATLTFTHCDADGAFQLEEPHWFRPDAPPMKVFLIVMHPGTIGRVTEGASLPAEGQQLEAGDLTLLKAHTARLRVVDAGGRPLEGAWVEPGDPYLSAANFTKTDASGRCEIKNVPAGVTRISVRHGDLSHQSKIVIGDELGEQAEITLTLTDDTLVKEEPAPVSPPLGAPALEFGVRAWTDGQDRKLADFRGKVVVIDFWGVWCSSCIAGVPHLKQLAEKYAHRDDLVFLTIHSADGDLEQIKTLQKQLDWRMPTGIDQGTNVTDGVLTRGYAITGWPGTVIIDRQGKIAFTSALEEWTEESIAKEMARVAQALKLPPENPNATEDEQKERIGAILNYRASEQIDRALGTK